MNDARKRRTEIENRAKAACEKRKRKGTFRRQWEKLKAKSKLPLKAREARVFLKTGTALFKTLSTEHPTQEIMDMQKNGFWGTWDHMAVYVPPGQIMLVTIDGSVA